MLTAAVPCRPARNPGAARARLETVGARALSARELLSLLLGEAGAAPGSAVDAIAERFLVTGGARELRALARADVADIASAGGIERETAARLLAGLELGLRAAQPDLSGRNRLETARDVYERLRLRMAGLAHEEFWLLALNTQHEILRELCVSRGLLTEAPIHPREVFRVAILEAAAALVLVHNHPSGEPTPSAEDDLVTANLGAAGHTIGICIIDHVIVGEDRYYSYAEANRLQAAPSFSFGSRHETRLHVEPRKRRSRARAGRTLQTNGSPT